MSGFLETAVQNSQGDESIKAQTLRILQEAKEIRESVGDEDSQREYEEVRLSTIGALTNLRSETRGDLESIRSELGEGGSIDVYEYAQGDITQSELSNITKEFEDLKRTSTQAAENPTANEAQPEINNVLLAEIAATNSEIIAGGETRLAQEVDSFINSYWKLSIIQQISDADYAQIESDLQGIKNTPGSIHTKLLMLSQVIYKANNSMTGVAKASISAYYGGDFESTHNLATQDIIKRVIDNSDNTFAVGFNKETGGYYVNEGEIDKTNDMEVGTYLCSLNKSEKLNKNNLLHPDGPFSPTELFDLIKKYKDGDFGGEEVRGLFEGYLEGFEENMDAIARDYLANEENGSHIIAFLNAKKSAGNTHPIYGDSGITNLAETLASTDISGLENEDLKNEVLDYRRQQAGERFIAQLSEMYNGDEEIMDMLGPIVMTAVGGVGNKFDFGGVNDAISQYNERIGNNGEQVPLIQGDILVGVEASIASLYEANESANWLEESQNQLDQAIAEGATRSTELHNLQKQLVAAVGGSEVNQELVNELQGKIQVLQRRSFYAQTQIDQAEADNEEARTAAEESALESERSVDNFRNIIEEEGYIESRENRIRSILENPSNIRAVINKEELLGIFSSEDRGALINADINFQDINPNLRSDKDIIMSFPGHLNAHDITFLPHSLLADENFHFTMSTITKSLMIGDGSNIHALLLASMRESQNSIGLVRLLAEKIGRFENEHQEIIRNNIPLSLQRVDSDNLLGIENKTTVEIHDISYYQDKLATLPNKRDLMDSKEESAARRTIEEIDAFFELRGISMERENLLKDVIRKGYLSQAPFARLNINRSPEVWKLIVDNVQQNLFDDLKYIPLGTRNSDIFYDYLLEKSNASQWNFIDDYLVFDDIPDLYRIYSKLQEKEGINSEVIKGFLSLDPAFRSIAQAAINSGNINGYSQEQKDFVSDILASGQEYDSAFNNIRTSIPEQLGNDIELGKQELLNAIKNLEVCSGLREDDDALEELVSITTNNFPEIHAATRNLARIFKGNMTDVRTFIIEVSKIEISRRSIQSSEFANNERNLNEYSLGAKEYMNEDGSYDQEKLRKLITISISSSSNKSEALNGINRNLLEVGFTNQQLIDLQTNFINIEYDNIIAAAGLRYLQQNPEVNPGDVPTGQELYTYTQENIDEVINDYRVLILPESQEDTTIPINRDSSKPQENISQTPYEIGGTQEKPTLEYNGNKINISPEEANGMRNNPEAIENFINADKYFSSIGLESIWRNYRKEIVIAMNMSGGDIQINLNDDSLGQLEFIKFSQYAYKIANGENSQPSDKVNELQNQFYVYGDIHAEDKSLLGDRFITDLNTLGINKELTSGQIAARFSELATGEGLSQEIENL